MLIRTGNFSFSFRINYVVYTIKFLNVSSLNQKNGKVWGCCELWTSSSRWVWNPAKRSRIKKTNLWLKCGLKRHMRMKWVDKFVQFGVSRWSEEWWWESSWHDQSILLTAGLNPRTNPCHESGIHHNSFLFFFNHSVNSPNPQFNQLVEEITQTDGKNIHTEFVWFRLILAQIWLRSWKRKMAELDNIH